MLLQLPSHQPDAAPQQEEPLDLEAVWQRIVQGPGAEQAAGKLDRAATPGSVLAQRFASLSTSSMSADTLRSLSHLSSLGETLHACSLHASAQLDSQCMCRAHT